MSKNEVELLEIVRENDNPEWAVQVAVEIILGYLAQHGSFAGQAAADLPESCGTDPA